MKVSARTGEELNDGSSNSCLSHPIRSDQDDEGPTPAMGFVHIFGESSRSRGGVLRILTTKRGLLCKYRRQSRLGSR